MSHTPHMLLDEFPDHADKIHKLKNDDAYFKKLYDRYEEVNKHIYKAETDIEPVGDDYMEAMRTQRVALKDEIYAILTKH